MRATLRRGVLPAAVSAQLEILEEQLLMGEIGLQDLPAPLAAFFHLGAAEERARQAQRLQELEHECDRLYLALANPRDRAAELQRRLDTHFEEEAQRFFHPQNDYAANAA